MLAMTLGLAACGGPGGRDSAEGTALTIWADDKRAPAMREAADKFSRENGVTVDVQTVSKDLQANFVTAAQAGKGPDLVLGAHDWIGNLVQNGTIDPIVLVDQKRAQFDPLAIKGVTFNGQTYGVPFAIENVVLFRNTDLVPQAPRTIEELVDTGRRLVASGKVSEIMALPVGQNGDAYHSYPIFTAGGGYLFGVKANGDYDPKDLGLSQPSATAAMQRIRALGEAGAGALKRSISNDNANSLFATGKTAFLLSGPWQIPDLKKAGVRYDISPIPGFAGGPPAKPFVGVQAMYVASQGRSRTLAQEFATNFFAQPDIAVALYKLDPRPPALIAALDQIKVSDPDMEKVLAAGKGGDIMPAIPEMNTVWDPFGKAEAAVVGGAQPAETTTAAASAIEAQIK
jgi:arabinogalactan oligomer/maltooligosaccharide transport system substrate-binding protein